MSVLGRKTERSSHGITEGGEPLADGTRVGRFVVLRDIDGRLHAVAAGSVGAVSETDDGDTLLMLPGGRVVRVGQRLETVLGWLNGHVTR